METFYTIIALLTAGTCLGIGTINLLIGLHKEGDKADLIFGIMCLSMCIFFLLPPIGFILDDKAPYSLQIIIKRLFNFSFTALLPWFISLYCGLTKKIIPAALNLYVLITYLAMCFAKTDSPKPVWVLLALLSVILNVAYGFYAALTQIAKGEKNKARWFIFALSFVAVLSMLGIINQLGDNYFGQVFGTKLFFPINLYPLSFILIIGAQLRTNIFEKFRLEKILHWRDARWDSLVQSFQLLVVELDKTGKIEYLNPYTVEQLGYHSLSELTGKNWFDCFAPKQEVEARKSLYIQNVEQQKIAHWISHLIAKNGTELVVDWTNVFVYDNAWNITATMSVGLNITAREKAFKEVEQLKNELEKESLLLSDVQLEAQNETGIIGESQALLYAIQKAKQVAATNATVLLEGETGVGKELFANLIHKHSYRSNKTFIKVNCAALPPELIESELFGHEKGAFTGALHARKGRFELADGGTIFLDEIGELPLVLQPKLLRVLQAGEFERIGSEQSIKVDVRIISATNRDLLHQVNSGQFREDLYYRLNVFPITIPPLRNRKEDIPVLIKYFVQKFSAEHNKSVDNISAASMIRLTEYPWPGNIRELINVIERSVISSQSSTLKLDWMNLETSVLSFSIEEVERAHILKVLKDTHWKINGDDGAAVKLGLHPNTLRSRLKKLNISRSEA